MAKARANPWVALAVVNLATFMILVDVTIVNVALPSIRQDLRTTFAEIEFVVAGYQLAYAVVLITGGRLGDLAGRRRMLLIGQAGFVAASVASGLAPSGLVLVAARLAQGLFAGLIYPQVLSVIQVAFPPERRGRALGTLGAVNALGLVAGPVLGGVLIRLDPGGLDWRTIFLVNVPVGLVALPAGWFFIGESREKWRGGLDLAGVGLSAAGLAAVVFPLVEGRELGWPAWSLAMLAAAPLILAGFIVFERRRARRGRPTVIELSVFNRTFTSGLLAALVFFASLPSFSFTLSIYLQAGRHLSPLATGLTFVPFAAGSLVVTPVVRRFADARPKRLTAVGAGLLCLGLIGVLVAVWLGGPSLSPWQLVPGLLLLGGGVRLVITPLFTLVLATTREGQAGSASGVLSTCQRVGGAIGVALAGVIFFGLFRRSPELAFELALIYNLAGFGLAAVLLARVPAPPPGTLGASRLTGPRLE